MDHAFQAISPVRINPYSEKGMVGTGGFEPPTSTVSM